MEKLVAEGDHPSWLTQGRTILVMKGPTRFNPQQLLTNRMTEHNVEAAIWYNSL